MRKIITAVLLLVAVSSYAQTTPCKGKTKSGKACSSVIVSKQTGYCNAHNPNRVKCTGKTTSGKPCQMVVLKESNVCRFHAVKKGAN